jgi:hypothetical protein
MHQPYETKPWIRQLKLTACIVCHSCVTFGRSRVQCVNYFNIKTGCTQVHIHSIQLLVQASVPENIACHSRQYQLWYTIMLFNNAASTTCYVVKGGGKITRLLGCYTMWAGILLQTFRQHYSPRSTFSLLYDWSIYYDRQRKYTYPQSRQPVTFPKWDANSLQYKPRTVLTTPNDSMLIIQHY